MASHLSYSHNRFYIPGLKRNAVDSNQLPNDEDEDYYDPHLSSITDQLISNINEQIENERSIELDESKTLFAQADNFIVIDAGNGQCVILDCKELLRQNAGNLNNVEDVRLYDSRVQTDEPPTSLQYSSLISIIYYFSNGNDVPHDTPTSHSSFKNPARIKHTCPTCFATFGFLNKYIAHLKEAHMFDEENCQHSDERRRSNLPAARIEGQRKSSRPKNRRFDYSQFLEDDDVKE